MVAEVISVQDGGKNVFKIEVMQGANVIITLPLYWVTLLGNVTEVALLGSVTG